MKITEEQINLLINTYQLQHSEQDFRRIPMEAENELMDKIRQGRYQDLHFPPFSRLDDNLGRMAATPLQAHAYFVVAAITLFSRAATEAGANSDAVFDLADVLLFCLSHCKTSEEIHEIYQHSAVMFAKLVHQKLENEPSYQVERILNYVSRNIYKKITLAEIAEYVDLTPHYLCALFSREMNISLHNYIQREKVNISCNLLRFADRSISDIASYMGFQTQSHYAKIFRKWKGMSPSEFREKNYREVF